MDGASERNGGLYDVTSAYVSVPFPHHYERVAFQTFKDHTLGRGVVIMKRRHTRTLLPQERESPSRHTPLGPGDKHNSRNQNQHLHHQNSVENKEPVQERRPRGDWMMCLTIYEFFSRKFPIARLPEEESSESGPCRSGSRTCPLRSTWRGSSPHGGGGVGCGGVQYHS